MINNLKNKLERLSISSTALGLMFLSLACTEVKVVEKPGETVYVEVPGETETVYVYVDQGPDQVNEQADQFAQDMDEVLNPDQDAQTLDMDVMDELDQEYPDVPDVDQELPEIQDMDPRDEVDAQVPEADLGMIFEPSEDLRNLELRPCSVDNSRFDESQLVKTYETNFTPSRNFDPENFMPENLQVNFWSVSNQDFQNQPQDPENWSEVACFEYLNTSDEPLVLPSISFRINGGWNFDFYISFEGSTLENLSISRRDSLTINPENFIVIQPQIPFQVKFKANLNDSEAGQFLMISEQDFNNFYFQNLYIFNIHDILQVDAYDNAMDYIFADYEDGFNGQEIFVNQVNIFKGYLNTFFNSHSLSEYNVNILCESTGGTYGATLQAFHRDFNQMPYINQNVILRPGLNSIPLFIPPMEIHDSIEVDLHTDQDSTLVEGFQAPEAGDSIQCRFDRDQFPADSTLFDGWNNFYFGFGQWSEGSIFGNLINWVEPGISSPITYIYFYGDTPGQMFSHQIFENNPNLNPELLKMAIFGEGNLQSIEFETTLNFHAAIQAEIQITNSNGIVLETHPIVINNSTTRHDIQFQNLNQVFGEKYLRILPVQGQEIQLPNSLDDLPPRLKFDLIALETFDEDNNPISINANLGNTPRAIPFVDSSVYYYFNNTNLYLSSTFVQDQIYDLNSPYLPEEIEIANFSVQSHSMQYLCINYLVFGKRDKAQEAFNQIWIDWDILVPNRNVHANFVYIDFRDSEQCQINLSPFFSTSLIPEIRQDIPVKFSGELNPQTVNGVDHLEFGLMQVQGYSERWTDQGLVRTPFSFFVRDNQGQYNLYNPLIHNPEGDISSDLINQNFPAAPKSQRITFINQ